MIKNTYFNAKYKHQKLLIKNLKYFIFISVNGDWGWGIGDWGLGLGPIPNPQSPIPNPQSPIPILIEMNDYLIK